MSDNDDFQTVDAGASKCFPMQCSALRKNGFVLIKGFPCKIVEMSTSKTGKHGHAKVHLVGIDIFTGKKYEDLCPSTHNMYVPEVSREDYQVMDISPDSFVSLLNQDGEPKDDLKVPEGEIGTDIRACHAEGKELTVTVLKAMGQEQIITWKEGTK